jgi:hypothetical protein
MIGPSAASGIVASSIAASGDSITKTRKARNMTNLPQFIAPPW